MTYATTQEIASALSIARQAVTKKARSWHSTRQKNANNRIEVVFPLATLPADIVRALEKSRPAPEPAPLAPKPAVTDHDLALANDHFQRAEPNLRADANQRAAIVADVLAAIENGERKTDVITRIALARNTDRATVYRWFSRVRGTERAHWPALLLDKCSARGRSKVTMSDEAWNVVLGDYLQTTQRPLKCVYNDMLKMPEAQFWTVPDYRTVLRRVNALDPHIIVLARKGEKALARLYPAQDRDRTTFNVCEAFCADGHKFDVMVTREVRTESSIRTEQFRPMIVAWQDLRTAKVLSWRIANSENADMVRLSFLDACERYSVPAYVYLDNGRGFTSLMLSGGAQHRFRFKSEPDEIPGLFVYCGVDPRFTKPYNGQAKPIERAWGDLINYIEKHPTCVGAYTGNDPLRKPERFTTVPYDTFVALVRQQIDAHNARDGRRGQDYAGRSFDTVFADLWPGIVRKQLTKHQIDLWRAQPAAVAVPKGEGVSRTVTAYGNRYWAPELTAHAGTKIWLRLDPENLQAGASAYTAQGLFIAALECQGKPKFNDREAARSHEQARKTFVRSHKKALAAERVMELSELQRITAPKMLEAPEREAPIESHGNVVAGVFQQRQKTAAQRAMHAALEQSQADELAARRAAKGGGNY